MRLSKYFATTSLVVLALAGAQRANAAEAAAAAAAPGVELEEVLVTAQKRSENLQDTPISISVMGDQAVENRHVYSLVDLGDGAIPSLKVAPFYSRPGALIMNIRGIGVLGDSNQPGRDQGVGVYVDGVYMARPQGLGVAMYDVDSIEVLKGPQGTLFGRNTEGGAVQITTKKPTGEFGLLAKAGFSSFSGYTGEMHLDLPEYANFSVKVDGVLTGRHGWVHNPLPQAEDFGGYTKRAGKVRVLWQPSDNFSADYAYDTAYDATTTLYQQFVGPTPLTTLAPALGNTASTSRIETATYGVPEQESVGNTWGHRLTAEWQLSDNLTIKSITAYRDLKQDQWDNGSTALSTGAFKSSPTMTTFVGRDFGRYSLALFTQDQVSQEFQIIGDAERLKWVAGAMYFKENVKDNARAFATNTFTDVAGVANLPRSIDYLAQRIDRSSEVESKSMGVFAQATYNPPILNDALHLTAGGRWTKDEKVGRMLIINDVKFPVGSQGQIFFAGTTPIVSPNPMDASWDSFDPIVNVGYDVSEDFLVYAKYSTGSRSGGSNSRALTYKPFDPETVHMMEVGAKIEFFDRRARLNVAAYDGTYKDIQLDFRAPYLQTNPAPGAIIPTNRTTTETVNAPGEGKLKGFEADFTFAATENLTLSANYAYNQVDIPATRNPFPQIDGTYITVPIPIYQVYTPENSASFEIDYERPFLGATMTAHLDANYGDGFYTSFTDFAYNPLTRDVLLKNTKGDSSFIVNGRIALGDIPAGEGTAQISIWSRNLLNEEHLFYKGTADPRTGYGGFFNEPRTIGMEISVKM